MIRYVIKRLLQLIPVLLGVIFIVQLILSLTPGDVTVFILGPEWTPEAAAALEEKLGLNKPFIIQYINYVWQVFHGNLGNSYITGDPVLNQIKVRFVNTMILIFAAMLICVVISIPIGIRAATKPNSFFSVLTTSISLIGLSMPTFWFGLMLILIFCVHWKLLPSSGLDSLSSWILPSVTLSVSYMASTMRMTRSSLLEALNADYVRTAKAKGVLHRDVVNKHALRNSLLPTVNTVGMNIGRLMGGAVITETIFSVPGLGRMLIDSLQKRDTPSVLAVLLVMAAGVGITTLAVDLVCAYLDPRIKAKYVREG